MTEQDHKYNALLAMDYFIKEHGEKMEAYKGLFPDSLAIKKQQELISEMRASRKFIEEN